MALKKVYSARDVAEATILITLMRDAGVKAVIGNVTLHGATGELPVGEATAPKVLVDELLYDKARKIAEEYEAMLQSGGDVAEISDVEGQFDWPICPVCDELREMTCLGCNFSGSEFMESTDDEEEEVSSDLPRMVCLRCQAVTPLALHPTCRFCKHDFSADEPSDALTSDIPADPSHNRIILLVAMLFLLFVLFLFWIGYAF